MSDGLAHTFQESRVLKRLRPLPPEMGAAAADTVNLLTVFLWSEVRKNPPKTPIDARHMAQRVVAELRTAGLLPGSGSRSTPEAIIAKFEENGERPIRGVSHLVAEALVLLDLAEVHRDVLWEMMPEGRKVRGQFAKAVRKFDQWRWIARAQEGTLRVLDRAGLANWFTVAEDLDSRRRRTTFDIAAAVRAVNEAIEIDPTAADSDVRRLELASLKRLMESVPGTPSGERGQVRIVHKSNLM